MPRKAMPIDIAIARGNKNRLTKKQIEERKEVEDTIKPRANKIDAPEWLDDIGTSEFNRVSELLSEIKLITEADITLLAAYADAYSEYVECSNRIKKDGIMIDHVNTTGKKNKIVHPLSTKKKQLFEQIKAVATELGMTPSSRAKIAIPKKEKKKPTEFDKMFGDV
jgi:P27 family predicted phage terminase small subunit